MSQLSSQHGQNGENERLTMNKSEVETTLSEQLSCAEGRQHSDTHTLTSRAEDDAPVAKECMVNC